MKIFLFLTRSNSVTNQGHMFFPRGTDQTCTEAVRTITRRLKDSYQLSFIYLTSSLMLDLDVTNPMRIPSNVLLDAYVVAPSRPVGIFTFLSQDISSTRDDCLAYNSNIARFFTCLSRQKGFTRFLLVHGVFDFPTYADQSSFLTELQQLEKRTYIIGMNLSVGLSRIACDLMIQLFVQMVFKSSSVWKSYGTRKMIQSTILLTLGFTIVLITWNEVQGEDFLVAVHRKTFKETVSIYADPGETGGVLQIQYPSYGYKISRSVRVPDWQYIPLEENRGTNSGIEGNSILVTCSDHAGKVFVQAGDFKYNVFSPLKLTALGTHYIVSSCHRTGQFHPFMVIATAAGDTNVDITFSSRVYVSYEDRTYTHGDTLSLRLTAYQTFTLESYYDLSGTIVNSTQSIALFIGLMNSTSVVAYDQLLPIKLYSKEYVVSVDNNTALYNLQIISQDNGTLINFNNGTRAVVDGSGFYRRQLQQNEMFHFTSTSPVMTTLCRLIGEKSGFLSVPPVSFYNIQTMIRLPRLETTAVLMTTRSAKVNISSSQVFQVWSNIPNSGHKVGLLQPVAGSAMKVSSGISFTGAVLFYQAYSIYSYGLSTEDVVPVFSETKQYILAFPQRDGDNLFLSAVAETYGFWQVQYPHAGEMYNRLTVQDYADRLYFRKESLVKNGVENKTIIVTANNDIHVECINSYYFNKSMIFSPLPVSALGKKYIVPSCYDPYVNKSLLVVATGKEMADVHIIFKLSNQSIIYGDVTYTNGDILRVRLLPYQTLTIKTPSLLCGTTISANRNVAVFSGTDDPASYMQILPVRLHGQEYVVAVQPDPSSYLERDSINYHILIIGEDSETQITFNNTELVSLGERQFYQRQLLYNESIFFKSTRPVMVTVYLFNNLSRVTDRPYFTCSVVPPISLYTYSAAANFWVPTYILILTEKSADGINMKRSIGRSWTEDVSADWTDIPDSDYKVGTCLVSGRGTLYVNSNTAFTVLGYGYHPLVQFIYITGYRFHRTSTLPDVTTTLPIHDTNNTDTDLDRQRTITIIVGSTLGLIVVVLVIIIAGLVIYIRRFIGLKGQADSKHREEHSSHEQCRQRETTFTSVEKDVSAEANVAVICSGRTYEHLSTENQTENSYEPLGNYSSTQGQHVYENTQSLNCS